MKHLTAGILLVCLACGSPRGSRDPSGAKTTPTPPPPAPESTRLEADGAPESSSDDHGASDDIPQAARPSRIEDLSWLAGTWRLTRPAGFVEEVWVPAAGGAMLGVGRTITEGRMTSFEFLRIEQRGDRLVYVAQPQGRAATEFERVEGGARQVRFENPRHDFPKWICYERTGNATMRATIGSEEREIQFSFGRPR